MNPGLSRRFAIEDAFRFEDFTDQELLAILNLKLKQQDLDATAEAKSVAIDILGRARNRPNFGNGGEVENLLGKAKGNYQARQSKLPVAERSYDVVFEPIDFDLEFNRAENSGVNLAKLFEDVVGCEKIVKKLEEYQNIARVIKSQGKDPREARELIPTNFVFKGPPGKHRSCGLLSLSSDKMNPITRYRKDDHGAQDGTSLLRHGVFVFGRSYRVLSV